MHASSLRLYLPGCGGCRRPRGDGPRWERKGGTRRLSIVTCGATSGPHPETDLQRLFWKQVTICGSTMGRPEEFRPLWRTFDLGLLRPVIDAVHPLEEIREAQAKLERGDQFGKLVLTL